MGDVVLIIKYERDFFPVFDTFVDEEKSIS